MTIQYRVIFAKNDEAVDGPDDAAVVVSVGVAEATMPPATAFMLGKLKNTGPTGPLLQALRDGSAAAAISRLASRP